MKEKLLEEFREKFCGDSAGCDGCYVSQNKADESLDFLSQAIDQAYEAGKRKENIYPEKWICGKCQNDVIPEHFRLCPKRKLI